MNPLLVVGDWDEWVALDRSRKPTPLFQKIGPDATDAVRADFARWLLNVLKAQAQHCIGQQTFPAEYEPLSPAWAETKRKRNLEPGFWIASGFLVNSLQVWKGRGELVWNLGWRASTKHPDSGTPVTEIAHALEFGVPDKNLPARPLFTLLAMRVKKASYRYFYQFCTATPKYRQYMPMLPRP